MLLLIWTVVFIVMLMMYFNQVNFKFSRYGVKTLNSYPIVGNMLGVLTKREHISDILDKLYFKFPEERFVGRYDFLKPVVIPRDLDLIKKVTIKDFENFIDHRRIIDEKLEPLFGRNLVCLKGQEWKDMRSTLSPAFTSSKIKLMVPFMDEVAKQTVMVLEKKIKAAEGYTDVNVKDLTGRYANDVVASCAFGLKVDSHMHEDNTFFQMGKSIGTIKFKQLLIFIVFASFPPLVKWLRLSIFKESARIFFSQLVLDTMREREVKNIVRHDMIHLFIQAKKVWSDDDLIAQAMLFLLAGFETVSTALSFALYEIAQHPEIQERLVKEIKELNAKNNGKIDFQSIQNLTYLDMVISESLRMWPPLVALDRQCIKDYNLGKPNEKATCDYIIRKGEILSIPNWSIHHSPEYYPNPEKFDPERFSEVNKHKINPLTYMPFGVGPRNCIGSRFALYKLKVLLYRLLLRMEVFPSEKLCKPVSLAKGSFTLNIEGGCWVRFKIRN